MDGKSIMILTLKQEAILNFIMSITIIILIFIWECSVLACVYGRKNILRDVNKK